MQNQSYLLIHRTQIPTIIPDADHFHISPVTGSSLGIDDVRKLKEWASLKPFNKEIKVALLSNLHTATIAAQNALLKLLEEPPEMTYIIAHTNDTENILPTILSRCQRVHSLEEIPAPLEWMTTEQGEQENLFLKTITIETIQSNPYSIKQLIELSEKLAKLERHILIVHLDETIATLYTNIHAYTSIARTLEILLDLKKLIQQNCNLQLAIENALVTIFIDMEAKLIDS